MESVLRTASADQDVTIPDSRFQIPGSARKGPPGIWNLESGTSPGIFGASLELPAGGAGVGAPAAPDGCGQVRPGQPLHEAADRGFARPLPAGQIDRILVQRNDVDLDGNSGEQTRQPRGVLRRIVDA